MPILAAGSKLTLRSRGFTLIEILVVLVILALTLALVVPAVSSGLGASLESASRDLHTGLRKARSQAINQQRSTVFVLDLHAYKFGIGADLAGQLSRDFELHARAAQREMGHKRAGIRFYPDGSSSGGRLGLSQGEDYIWLEVDWLTGRVSRVEE